MSFFLLIGGMFLIMYLFMIRPQVKKQKEAKAFREELKNRRQSGHNWRHPRQGRGHERANGSHPSGWCQNSR